MVYEQTTKIRSTVTPELLHLTLKRGGLFGIAGGLMIIAGGIFLPLELLKIWGAPLFFGGLVLIAIGLLPYRRLTRLQMRPHELHYDGESLIFLDQGEPLFKIPENSIAKIEYVEPDHLYGLAIWLKRPVIDKVKVLKSHYNFAAYVADSAQRVEGCTLFLPYFSKGASRQIKGWLEQDHAS